MIKCLPFIKLKICSGWYIGFIVDALLLVFLLHVCSMRQFKQTTAVSNSILTGKFANDLSFWIKCKYTASLFIITSTNNVDDVVARHCIHKKIFEQGKLICEREKYNFCFLFVYKLFHLNKILKYYLIFWHSQIILSKLKFAKKKSRSEKIFLK